MAALEEDYHIISFTCPDHDVRDVRDSGDAGGTGGRGGTGLRRPWGYTLHDTPSMIHDGLLRHLERIGQQPGLWQVGGYRAHELITIRALFGLNTNPYPHTRPHTRPNPNPNPNHIRWMCS